MIRPDQFGSRCFKTATKVVEVALPDAPKSGEVVVHIHYAGVQASDIIQMSGGYGVLSKEKPAENPTSGVQPGDTGCEGVGVITQTSDVEEWPIGQPVSFFGYGVAFREVVVLPVESLIKIPSPDKEYTALPVSALTAVGGLLLVGKINSFDDDKKPSVLVTGAAGGTGHMAVQFAKLHGARVAGTCGSEEKSKMLSSIGTDVVVNYRTSADVENELRRAFPDGFDMVYDAVGGRIGNIGRRLLSPTGVFIGIGSVSQDYAGGAPDAANKADESKAVLKQGQSESFFFMPAAPQMIGKRAWNNIITETVEQIATGKLRVVMDEESRAFSGIEGVYKAQDRMRQGLNIGKIFCTFQA